MASSEYESEAVRPTSRPALCPDVAVSTRQALDALPDMMWVYARDLTLSFVNLVGRRLLGLSAGQLAGCRDEELFVSATTDAYLPTLQLAAANKRRAVSGRVLLQPRTSDAKALVCVITFTPVLDELNQVQCLIASANELPALVQPEPLHAAVAGFAHDINNLLTVIGNYHSFIANGPLSPQQSSDLKIAMDATHSGGALAERLLLLSKGQQSTIALVDANHVVASTTEMLRPVLGDAIQLSLELAGAPLLVRAGAGELEQIIVNLAFNSRDAMLSGPLGIRVSSTIVLHGQVPSNDLAPGEYAVISIKDAGPGIDAATLSRIFEPFFTTKALYGGTGLGLFMVKEVATRLGGAVRIETAVGQGCEFFVYLPTAAAACNDLML
ncbi:MAG: HAMP domain-containing sensor histidine kinase [Pseudomonadota bacterium]